MLGQGAHLSDPEDLIHEGIPVWWWNNSQEAQGFEKRILKIGENTGGTITRRRRKVLRRGY
jgi:hypothetical protein